MNAGWPRRKLGELLRIQNGYAFDSKAFAESGTMPLIRIRDLENGVATEARYTGPFDERYVVRAGDLLIGMDGEFGCYEWRGEDALLNQRVCRLQEFEASLLPKFVLYGVNSYLKAIEDVTAFATVKHLSSKQVLEISFPVPPVEEQQRIVAVLDEAFAGIAAARASAERNLRNARALFEELADSLFSPDGKPWPRIALTHLSKSVSTGPFGSMLHQSDYVSDGVPLVNPINIVAGEISPDWSKCVSEEAQRRLRAYVLRAGDVVIGRRGEMGRCGVVGQSEAGWICGTGCFFIRPSGAVEPGFVAGLLRSRYYRAQLESAASGATMPNLSNRTLAELTVAVPGRAAQIEILEELDAVSASVDRLASVYQRKLAALDELKQSLLHHAFTGQLTARTAAALAG